MEIKTGYNSTYKKLAVQCLNEALSFVSSSVLADSFVLRNRQLLIAAKRYKQPAGQTNNDKIPQDNNIFPFNYRPDSFSDVRKIQS